MEIRPEIRVKRLREEAVVPSYGTDGAAAADLYAAVGSPVGVPAGGEAWIPTGIAMEIPAGYAGLVFARSSMGAKRGLAPANKVGVIDSDYRGEITVVLHNHSQQTQTVLPGERIAQIAVVPVLAPVFTEAETLSDTGRGGGGFGSTGR